MEKVFTIYSFQNNVNGKQYIGSTIVKPQVRYNQHIYNATHEECHQYHYPLYEAIRKYGIENFTFSIIEQSICTEQELREKEQQYIIQLNTLSPNGYNQTLDTIHPINAIESYQKMSQTKRDNANCVVEVDKDFNIIKQWNSIVDCAENTGLSEKLIAAVCRGEQKSTSGRIFCWINNNKIIIPEYKGFVYKGEKGTTQKQITNRKVAKINKDTNEILEIYDSIALASRENNCDRSSISKVCKGTRNIAGGYKWKYIDEVNNEK